MTDTLPVQIYYEDTDHSGVVYHANYLKYFERAREHLLGVEELVRLWEDDGIGFVVYKCSMKFREGARFGDRVQVRTTVRKDSAYRLVFVQQIWRPEGKQPMVDGLVELACVDRDAKLIPLPQLVLDRLGA
ncbi:MAG: YbgC/FadM family acyl-CoA thioesterase [Myxococcota bacterium]|nr:YbgC/FadM family acyl-CoA thioesterase [Myxococcota bacterium]